MQSIKEILELLRQQGITIRADDGDLNQINISIPTSTPDAFVIGLRYIKRDDSQTEDHFLCQKGVDEIKPFYGRRLERKFPEYRSSHKTQVDLPTTADNNSYLTEVNTFSFRHLP